MERRFFVLYMSSFFVQLCKALLQTAATKTRYPQDFCVQQEGVNELALGRRKTAVHRREKDERTTKVEEFATATAAVRG